MTHSQYRNSEVIDIPHITSLHIDCYQTLGGILRMEGVAGGFSVWPVAAHGLSSRFLRSLKKDHETGLW